MNIKSKLKRFGGKGLFDNVLSTSNLYRPDFDKVLAYLIEKHPLFYEARPLSQRLEAKLCEYHNAENCIMFSSGFWALVAAIKIKALGGKKNVIIPSMTYRRLADVVHWAGLTPVFVDVYEHNLAISVEAVSKSIDEDTALILAVHPIVNCCDVDSFIELAEKRKVPLVFDAVESVHETYKGRRIGSFGCGEVFSFHASKLINGCEGGYVCTDDDEFASRLVSLKSFGVETIDMRNIVGMDARPVDGHSAFALAGLDEIERNVNHNKDIYKSYKRGLTGIQGLRLVEFDEREQTSYKNIVLEVLDQYPVSRDSLVKILNGEGLLARSHYDPPLHKKEYQYDVIIKDMKNTDKLHTRFINMPCGSIVTVNDVEKIIHLLELIYSEQGFCDIDAGV